MLEPVELASDCSVSENLCHSFRPPYGVQVKHKDPSNSEFLVFLFVKLSNNGSEILEELHNGTCLASEENAFPAISEKEELVVIGMHFPTDVGVD